MPSRVDYDLRKSVNSKIFPDQGHPERLAHFGEIVSRLLPDDFDTLVADIETYERDGTTSPLIEDIRRRARCIADSELLIDKLDLAFEGLENK